MTREQTAAKNTGIISLAANVVLTAAKVGVGASAGSEVLLSDGFHSAIDIAASAATIGAVVIAYRPPDDSHPYGHGKAQDVASAVISLILCLVGVYVLYSSGVGLYEPTHNPGQLPLYTAILSLIVKEVLFRYTLRQSQILNSPALASLAQDHRSDIWGSWAAVIGVACSLIGYHIGFVKLGYADPIMAFLVGLMILRTSIAMGADSARALMEHNVSLELIEKYRILVLSIPEVKRLDKIRARHLGHYIMVDVRVSIPGLKTIQEGHDISRRIKATITDAYPDVHEVLVHLNPFYEKQ